MTQNPSTPVNAVVPTYQSTSQPAKDSIIHRTANCTLFNDQAETAARKIQRDKDLRNKGWFSKDNMPYQQLGDFANVLQGIEGVKQSLPHTKLSMDFQTHRNIKILKRVTSNDQDSAHNSGPTTQIVLSEPGRTQRILNQYQGQLKKLRAASQVGIISSSNQMTTNNFQRKRYSNQDQDKNRLQDPLRSRNDYEDSTISQEVRQREAQLLRLKNSRLHTASLKRLINEQGNDDGRHVLKAEIEESNQRVQQIRHGMLINQMIKQKYFNTHRKMSEERAGKPNKNDIDSRGQIKGSNIGEANVDQTFPLTAIRTTQNNKRTDSNMSKTQPVSPSKKKPSMSLQETIGTNQYFQSLQDPGGVIFIPNYYQNKKPKIIRFSDLTKLIPKGGETTMNSGIKLINAKTSAFTKRMSDYGDSQNTGAYGGFSDELRAQGFGGGGSSSITNTQKKTNINVNYHKKLQDEFDRYEMLHKSHMMQKDENPVHQQPPGQFINSLISNQFLNRSIFNDGKLSIGSSNSPRKVMSRDTSQSQSESPSQPQSLLTAAKIQTKIYKPQKQFNISQLQQLNSSSLVFQAKSNDKTNNADTTPLQNQKNNRLVQNGFAKRSINPNQNQLNSIASSKDTQVQQSKVFTKGFDQKLTKYEKDMILSSAITSSIKYFDPQEEAELLQTLSEDVLWKECQQLLTAYFKINFLSELKDNKVLLFRLYKLYLLHSVSQNIKTYEENINSQSQNQANSNAISKSGNKRSKRASQSASNDDGMGNNQYDDSSDDEQNYGGHNGNEVFKQKMQGFIRLLQEILNPTDKDALELDSVFQLKNLVKQYYEKKGELVGNLTETLYAMMHERPNILTTKKKYFFNSLDVDGSDVQKIRNLFFELEQMRINAERDRIQTYKTMLEELLKANNSLNTVKKY